MTDTVIKVQNLRKKYTLGAIGGKTFNEELERWWAKKRGKEDPTLKIGEDETRIGEEFWALDGINLEVKEGEALGIIGANGAGKSTLLKILSRVTAPTEGEVWMKGRLTSMLEVGTGFHPEMTGRENIYMNGAILGMSRKEVDDKIDSIIEFSECGQFIDTPVKRYSSGMYVKLAFSVASHLNSDIMIMDEVLAVGDVKFQQKCLTKMGDAAGKDDKTILYVSHNMATIRSLCTRCILLEKGKLIFDGSTEQAIGLYTKSLGEDYSTHFDFRDMPKSSPIYRREVQLLSMELLNKEVPYYTTEENMEISCEIQGLSDLTEYRARIEVRYIDTTIVGMSESGRIGLIKKGERKRIYLSFPLQNLAEGSYYFRFSLFELGSLGVHTGLDDAPTKIFFTVTDSVPGRTRWLRQYWGSVRLNQIQIVSAE